MRVGVILRLLRTPHLRAQALVLADLQTFIRVHYLYAAMTTGLLRTLRKPASVGELTQTLGVKRPDLLESLLALGELSVRDGLYRISGARSKALADRRGDPLVAVIQEYATYHNSVYRELAARMRGAPLGDYLQETAGVVARSSRALEPFLADFAQMVVEKRGPIRILEIGCGSGVYLKHAADANPRATGTGIDVQPEAIRQATENLARWHIEDRFRVTLADARQLPPELSGPFDLITLYNNIYYFTPEERPALFRSLRERLSSGGRLAVVSAMQGRSPATNDLDLNLRSTEGCTALPQLKELEAQLRATGFSTVTISRLLPFESLYSLVAE